MCTASQQRGGSPSETSAPVSIEKAVLSGHYEHSINHRTKRKVLQRGIQILNATSRLVLQSPTVGA